MKNYTEIKERYLRDPLPVRLGGLAANLARIESFSDNPDHKDVIEHLLDESKYFIEWTALDADLEVQAELVELQVRLACWQHQLNSIWTSERERNSLAQQAGDWSKRVLELSGLLARK